ncbi:MAG: hypothetical protein M3N49_00075 [Candidatus Eremiobacteraeota bacterium]|nr:hypothetical protein [Candidatus Eremiobacteraeota bacterium]
MDHDHLISLAAGIEAAGILAVLAIASPGLFRTAGALSTSKLQFFLWTEAALFTYGFLFTAHAVHHPITKDFNPQFPDHLLLLMGLSITAGAASQAKPQPIGIRTDGAFARFFQNANGQLSLPKVQMLAWTFVAITVYLFTAIGSYYGPFHGDEILKSYPDVDTALLALVGLGQGAFVVNRFLDKESTD